ncbi:MAG TPA: hypothetical protein DDW31_08780 [candidate division Zixibacteria bacterium]|jgi:CxxC-x17-CxxC domain-containing protein|nr:hypothetical protein [candidate division Zixibacteria bacterium]
MIKKFNRAGRSGKREFSKPDGRGPRKFGGGGFRRPAPRDGGDFERDKQLHPATCSVCGAQCQVPFRPSGDRPIYCRDCFRKQDGDGGGRDAFRRDAPGPRRPAPFRRPEAAGTGELAKDLAQINRKLDRILEALEGGEEESE